MTAVNWLLRPGGAAVMTDTLRHGLDGTPLGFTSKITTMPHLNMVFVVRGVSRFSLGAYVGAREKIPIGAIDGFCDAVPEWLRDIQPDIAAEVTAANSAPQNPDAPMDVAEVLAFGWSDLRRRICGVLFSSLRDFAPQDLPDGMMFAPEIKIEPTEAERRVIAKAKSPESLIVGAKVQRREWTESSDMKVGGELVLCELRRHGLSMRVVHRFEEDFEAFARRQAGHD